MWYEEIWRKENILDIFENKNKLINNWDKMGKQYELYVQKGQPIWKVITNILFSHVGMFILVIGYCVGGQIFASLISKPVCLTQGPMCSCISRRRGRNRPDWTKRPLLWYCLKFPWIFIILMVVTFNKQSISLSVSVMNSPVEDNFMEHFANENDNWLCLAQCGSP